MRADAHLMLAFEGTTAPLDVRTTLAAGRVPGVTLYRFANVESNGQVAELTETLHASAGGDLPLLIAADQETGQFMGLGDETTPFPGAMALGAVGDAALAQRVAAAVGRELRALGVTMNYSPVCDVATNPANPSLGIRAFSDDPIRVSEMAAATIRGLTAAGVVATAKHFPGKGEAVVDPHHGLPMLDLDRERLDTVELEPFRSAIAAGVPAVMAGHYALPSITGQDDLPSSVSTDVITGLLRGHLGFQGMVITDALDMGALPQGAGQVVDMIAALRAGVDLLLWAPDRSAQNHLRGGLDLAVSRGLLAESHSVAQVDEVRRWLGGFPRPELSVVGSEPHRRLAAEVARRSVTLVRREATTLPLRPDGTLLAVMAQPADLTPADTSSTVRPTLASALRQHHPDVVEVITSPSPEPDEIAAVVDRTGGVDAVVLGTLSANSGQAAMVEALLATGKPLVTVAMRTPFDLASYPSAGTHLCTYSIQPPSMTALADILFGAAPALGRLPAAIPGLYERGHGLVGS